MEFVFFLKTIVEEPKFDGNNVMTFEIRKLIKKLNINSFNLLELVELPLSRNIKIQEVYIYYFVNSSFSLFLILTICCFCFLLVSFMFYHVVYGSDQHVIGCGCTLICIVFLSCFNHHIIMLKFIQKSKITHR